VSVDERLKAQWVMRFSIGSFRLAAVLGAAFALLPASGALAATSQTFTTPGETAFTVPDGVTAIAVDISGGQGGSGLSALNCQGGGGTRIQGTLYLTGQRTIYVEVGGAGGNDAMNQDGRGGYNGGGDGSTQSWGSGGGGGASDLRVYPSSDRIHGDGRFLIAAGGGGSGGGDRTCKGGDGGANPSAGGNGSFGATPGQPGTLTGGARGLSATCGGVNPTPSTDGSYIQGGSGAWTSSTARGLCIGSGGGGGGGFYGGGGGGASQLDADPRTGAYGGGAGGGAGSNLIAGSVAHVTTTTAAKGTLAPLNGSVSFDWTPTAPTAAISSPVTAGPTPWGRG
jgi:hypothetical protein